MTIKEYILDALEKFWTKVSTYIDGLTGRVTTTENAVAALNTVSHTTFSFFGVTTTIYKVGKIVLVPFYGTSQVALTSQTSVSVGILPAGYRPAFRVGSNVFTSMAGGARIQIIFNTDGNVTVYNHETTTMAAGSGFIRDWWVFFAA